MLIAYTVSNFAQTNLMFCGDRIGKLYAIDKVNS